MARWHAGCIASSLCFVVSGILHLAAALTALQAPRTTDAATATDASENANANHGGGGGGRYYSGTQINSLDPSYRHHGSSVARPPWFDLDPAFIERLWEGRHAARHVEAAAMLVGAAAWFLLAAAVVQVAWVLGRGGKRRVGLHASLGALAGCGAGAKAIAGLLVTGTAGTASWLAREFNLDGWASENDRRGWRVIEIINIVTKGMLTWVGAFESLAMFGITAIIFWSIRTQDEHRVLEISSSSFHSQPKDSELEKGTEENKKNSLRPLENQSSNTGDTIPKAAFGKCFGYSGLLVGILSLSHFIIDVLMVTKKSPFVKIALVYRGLLGIALPIWLLCLGRQLSAVTECFENGKN